MGAKAVSILAICLSLSLWSLSSCSIREDIAGLRADTEAAKSTIQREIGVAAHIGLRVEKVGDGSNIVVNVRLEDIPAMGARELKENVSRIVRSSLRNPVARVDHVL
jgi:hypothetical protein